MRVRTDDRRQAIIDVALDIFRKHGFERTSMAMISRQLGGSKGTLYGYFDSKEQLFETAMKAASEGRGDEVMSLLRAREKDLRVTLKRFAKAYLTFIVEEDVLAIVRTAIAEGSASSLGPHLYQQGPGRAIEKMTAFFAEKIAAGALANHPPRVAALHFKGLLEAGFLEEALYGAATAGEEAIEAAIDAFLRAYGNPAATVSASTMSPKQTGGPKPAARPRKPR